MIDMVVKKEREYRKSIAKVHSEVNGKMTFKGKAGDFYKNHRPLFQLRRNMPDIRRSIKAVLVKIYCKFYN